MDYDEMIARLRGYNPPDRTIDHQRQIAIDIADAADAITKLRAERDVLKDELRRTCEHLGLDQLLADRDALRADLAAALEHVKDYKENSELFLKLLQKTEADLAAVRDELRDLEIELTRARKQRDIAHTLLRESKQWMICPGKYTAWEIMKRIDAALAEGKP